MAKIVLGMGTSHTPMLLASDETLPRFLETDMKIKHRDKDGNPSSYDDLLLKADPQLAGMVTPEQLVARQNSARAAAKRLRQVLANAEPRRTHRARRRPERELPGRLPAGVRDLLRRHHPQRQQAARDLFAPARMVHQEPRRLLRDREAARLPGAFEARRTPDRIADGFDSFDLAASKCLRAGEGEGHAVAYVHRHVMDSAAPGAGRAGVPQHLLPADPAAAEALLRVRPGDRAGRSIPSRATRASASWPRAA